MPALLVNAPSGMKLRAHLAGALLAALLLLSGLSAQAGSFCARDSDRGHAWDPQTSSYIETPSTISGLTEALGSGGNCAAIGSSHIWIWDGQTASWSDSSSSCRTTRAISRRPSCWLAC